MQQALLSKRGNILLLDPRTGHCDLLTFLLREEGYSVVTAVDALEARDYMEQASEPPALILADVQLPYAQGGGIVREMRSLWADVPIYLLAPQVQQIDPSISLLATGIIRKPFAPEDLISKLGALLPASVRTSSFIEPVAV